MVYLFKTFKTEYRNIERISISLYQKSLLRETHVTASPALSVFNNDNLEHHLPGVLSEIRTQGDKVKDDRYLDWIFKTELMLEAVFLKL